MTADRPDIPNAASRFNEEKATFALRGSDKPDLDAGVAAIRAVVKTLPVRPGVYRMLDARGDVLYVGKARALKNRVTQYTQVARQPKRLLYDKAADADSLRESLAVRGILLLCPHRENRTRPSTNDGRAMRRYKRRYKVERTLSWLYNCRRLVTRWEYYPELFQSFVHLACLLTILNGF